MFEKAEGFARRLLERLGSGVDDRISGDDDDRVLGRRDKMRLISRLEALIDSNALTGYANGPKVAPNRIVVLFTHEDYSRLSSGYLDSLTRELTSELREFIVNRRYSTRGEMRLKIEYDLFAHETKLKAEFDPGISIGEPVAEGSSRRYWLERPDGTRSPLDFVGGPVQIGRSPSAQIRVDEPGISRHHCSISQRMSGELVVSDLESANGTIVNGVPLGVGEARVLKPGDVIRAGDISFTLIEHQ